MTSGVPPAIRRRSYREVARATAWWLLDGNRHVVASVRAASADEARTLFQRAGLTGAWIRRGRS